MSESHGTKALFPLSVPALRVVQPLGEFFITALPARSLLKVCYSNKLRLVEDDSSDHFKPEGTQREFKDERATSISRYIKTTEAAFPNSIILAANYDEKGELVDGDDTRWGFEADEGSALGTLTIPTDAPLAAIVDGQHRLGGFRALGESKRLDMELPCSVYLDLPNAFQAQLFATINYNQKPVNKNVTYQLYGYNLDAEPNEAWSPEKVAVFLARKLSVEDESPFKDHIVLTAQKDERVAKVAGERGSGWAVSTATVVEGILKLISSSPAEDRDAMHEKPLGAGRKRSLLGSLTRRDASPLRAAYLENRDVLTYTVVKNFFLAVDRTLWRAANARSYIRRTVGVQASFDVLRKLLPTALDSKDIRVEAFAKRLEPTARVDFSDNFFQASGKGRQRMRVCMELCLGLSTLADVNNDSEKKDFARLCGVS